MPVITVIGAQWGDEGKGKIVDMLAEKMQIIMRFSGGDNAGHTVVNPYGTFKLHIIPSGIFTPQASCFIGNGVVINPRVLIGEIDQLNERGVDTSRLFISDRAHLIMPYHLLLDDLQEKALGDNAIGTTRKGIGPAFSDKVSRTGIRTSDLLDKNVLSERLKSVIEHKNIILTKVYGAEPLSPNDVYNQYCQYADRLAPCICETTVMLEEALARKEPVLLEGAQGTLLDPDFGTYPFTTSSSPLSGSSCLGAGLGPHKIDHTLGVFKAYCTRVGSGPLPTELNDETGNYIREKAQEFGTTTGRPRRCGWFDAVAARFSMRINGFTSIAITRLDVLDDIPELKICIGYTLDGQTITNFPASVTSLAKCQPIYKVLPGWQSPTTGITEYEQLPTQARQYISRLEELISCPTSIISVGMKREETIMKIPLL